MNKKISIGITIGLMAITAAVTFIITSNVTLEMFNNKIKSVNEKQEFYSKLSEIDTYCRTHYISEIDESKLIDGMVSGYISGLGDEYAEYLSADAYRLRQEAATGVTVGLGFSYEKENNGYIRITEIVPGAAAEKAGLQAGDIITAVNNTDVIAYTGGYEEVIKMFSADEGTRVKLYIKRSSDNGSDFITYDVTSEKTENVTVTGRMINELGYIRIAYFNDRTESQLKNKLDELIGQGAQGLVFDLRGNKDGSMTSLGNSLDHIIGAGDIVTAEYMNGNVKTLVSCTEAEKIKMPMSVIVNGETSGCAELFAFALRDNCSAYTIGKTTAGKGYLQEPYTCSDGSVIMISTAVLKTSGSDDFNNAGLKPEFDVALPEDIDLNTISDDAAVLTDAQLIKALEVTVPKTVN